MNILANKYRPRKISDLIGQDAVVRILSNSILNNNLHHAYIFSGNFGCGKTSAARLLAACINNKDGITVSPNLEDADIQEIFEGKSSDINEIDAASSRSIDGIRALKEQIRFAPIKLKYRVVIIDEAHRLTGEAAEAALKMLEEPPVNVIFILCTTDADKLISTIHSRCVNLRFSKVSVEQLIINLRRIVQNEKIDIDDNALRIAARLSKGSVRNSLQNLQAMIAYSNGQKITSEIAQASLAAVDENKYFELVDAILKPDAGEGMRTIDSILGYGRDIGEVLDGLVGHIRTLLVIKTAKDTAKLLFLTEEEKKKYIYQSNLVTTPLLLYMIELIVEVYKSISVNANPQIMLEKFIICSIIFSRTENKAAG
jgi:DNA polymerase-3 subunit gamma/tau